MLADNLEINQVNDKPFEQGFFSSSNTLDLASGKHALVLKYKDVFEDVELGQDRVVESDWFVVKFTIVNQQALTLTTTKILDIPAAESFIKSPEIMLHDANNTELLLELERFEEYKLARAVSQVLTDLSTTVELTKLSKQEKSTIGQDSEELDTAEKSVHFSEQSPLTTRQSNNKVIAESASLAMLKFWWKKTSANEQQDFLQFISKK